MSGKFGAFGKFPGLGDFFRMDLAAGFVDPWDRWLQEAILAGKAALGDDWQERYFSAPIWRFTLAPGIVGATAMTGVMMMSVDRVGRLFPLTLAAPLPDGTDPALDHLLSAALFYDLEGVALAALEEGANKEKMAEALAAMAPVGATPQVRIDQGAAGAVVQGGDAGRLPAELAAAGLTGRFRRPSLWSADLETGTRLMVCEGLPAGGQVLALFDLAAPLWQPPTEETAAA